MLYLKYLFVSVASAFVATHVALWYVNPAPVKQSYAVTLPPLTVQAYQGDLLIWGSWQAVEGYEQPVSNAVEIRCNPVRKTCSEAYASILYHDEGEDLEAQVFDYEVVEWSDITLHAVAKGALAGCVDRNLYVNLGTGSASLELAPVEGCEGDMGRAVLVGDPV